MLVNISGPAMVQSIKPFSGVAPLKMGPVNRTPYFGKSRADSNKQKSKKEILEVPLRISKALFKFFLTLTLGVAGISLPWSHPGKPSTNGWQDNISVMASTGQESVSKRMSINSGEYYRLILKLLKRSDIQSLDQAQQYLENQGFPILQGLTRQYPVTSLNRISGWNKSDRATTRYVLIITSGRSVSEAGLILKTGLQDVFKIPSDNFKHISDVTSGDLAKSIKWLETQAAQHQGQPVEVLVFYTGHGGHDAFLPFLPAGSEGSAEGIIKLKDGDFTETEFKAMLNNKFKNVKVTLLFDTCYSGSWVA